MPTSPLHSALLGALLAAASALGCCTPLDPSAADLVPPQPPARILFVGNSFTFWNGGLWTHMEDLAAAREEGPYPTVERVVRGGASLEVMWTRTRAAERITDGNYDVVVLQEDLPETNVESFHRHAAEFDAHVRASGARPVFFMAWAYERLGWISMDEIAAEHRAMAEDLDAEVAPVGLAWERARRERPEVDMYARDREHPSAHGTYLALLVIYSTIYGESPTDLDFNPPEAAKITPEQDAWLRRVAWETVRAFEAE